MIRILSLVTLLVASASSARGQVPEGWLSVLASPFVTDTLSPLVGRRLVFVGNPANGANGLPAVAEYVYPDTIRLGALPDTMAPEYVLAHEVGHAWAMLHPSDPAAVNILVTHDEQERVGGYAAVRVGEHAAEAFAYATLIIRLPESERAAMLARVEQQVLGTTLMYERLLSRLVGVSQ